MNKKSLTVTWIITALVLILMASYGGGLLFLGAGMASGPVGFLRWGFMGFAILVILPLMILMLVTAIRRHRELREEDDDDLGQY